jgi:hypothetical protein
MHLPLFIPFYTARIVTIPTSLKPIESWPFSIQTPVGDRQADC